MPRTTADSPAIGRPSSGKACKTHFGAGDLHRVEVRAPAGVPLRIDGFDETAPYVGFYFDGQAVTVEAPGFRQEIPVREDLLLEVPPAT